MEIHFLHKKSFMIGAISILAIILLTLFFAPQIKTFVLASFQQDGQTDYSLGYPEGITRGSSFENVRVGNHNTLILYSGIHFVEEDGEWKHLHEARSLKGKGFSAYVQNDGTHLVEVVDFNASCLELDLSYDEANLGEYEHEIEEGKMKTKFKIIEEYEVEIGKGNNATLENRINETEIEIEIEEDNIENYIYCGNVLGNEFHFGENSTIIEIGADDGNLIGDTYSYNQVPSRTNEHSRQLYVQNNSYAQNYLRWMFINFNISQIPSGQTILDAQVSLYMTLNRLDNLETYNVSVRKTIDLWDESTLTWNNQPTSIEDVNSESSRIFRGGAISPDYPNFKYNFTITQITNDTYFAGLEEVPLIFTAEDDEDERSEYNDFLQFRSSDEDNLVKQRPTLIITYESTTDLISPEITIESPLNQSYTTTTIDFNFSSNEAVLCNYTLDLGITNITMTNSTNATFFTASNNTMAQGGQRVFAYCVDTSDNTNFTEFIDFEIDTQPPSIITELLNDTTTENSIKLNWTDPSDSDLNKIIILRDGVNIINITEGIETYTDTSLNAETPYNYTLHTADNLGNINNTDVSLVVTTYSGADLTIPDVKINSPTNTTYTTTSIDFNFTLNEAGYCNYTLDLGITNNTMTNSTNATFWSQTATISQGGQRVFAYCVDLSNNLNNTEFLDFVVDTQPPAVVTNLENHTTTQDSIVINWTDPSDSDLDGIIILRDDVNIANVSAGTQIYNDSSLTFSTTYNYTLHTFDVLDNINTTDVSIAITTHPEVDTTPPTITLVSPSDIDTEVTTRNSTFINVSLTPTDEDIDTCILEWAGTNESMSNSTEYHWYKNKSDLSDARYDYKVYCNNTDGFGDSTSAYVSINFIDEIPTISLNSPSDSVTLADSDVIFTFTPTDDRGFSGCSIYGNWSGGIWEEKKANTTAVNNGTTNTIIIYNIPDGIYGWNAGCTDTGGNLEYASANRTITIDVPVERRWIFRAYDTLQDLFWISKEDGDFEHVGSGIVQKNLTIVDTITASITNFGDLYLTGESSSEFVIGKTYLMGESPTGSPVMSVSGYYSGSEYLYYNIKINTSAGTQTGQATFSYSNDGTSTWEETGVITSTSNTDVGNRISIKWESGNFEDGDVYTFDVYPYIIDTLRISTATDEGEAWTQAVWQFNGTTTFNALMTITNMTVTQSFFDTIGYINDRVTSIFATSIDTENVNTTNLNVSGNLELNEEGVLTRDGTNTELGINENGTIVIHFG